jgi:hypothetical protein
MKKTLSSALTFLFCLASVPSALAAEAPVGTKRPPILQIFREHVKPGRQPAHAKNEAGWPAALRKANNKGYYLAMTSATEAWYLNPRESFAAAEAQAKEDEANTALTAELDRLWAQDGELLQSASTLNTVLNEGLSYRADWDTAKVRYYSVTIVRLQPGYGREYEQLRKLVNAAHDKAKVEERWVVYEVLTGAPDDTYIFMSPLATLAEWDKYDAMHGKEYQDALGEDGRSRLREFSRTAVKSSETQLFSFSPSMSYLPKEMMDRDPAFWSPKPAAPKKDEKKP